MTQEAKAGSRKATGIHNRPDRAIPEPKGCRRGSGKPPKKKGKAESMRHMIDTGRRSCNRTRIAIRLCVRRVVIFDRGSQVLDGKLEPYTVKVVSTVLRGAGDHKEPRLPGSQVRWVPPAGGANVNHVSQCAPPRGPGRHVASPATLLVPKTWPCLSVKKPTGTRWDSPPRGTRAGGTLATMVCRARVTPRVSVTDSLTPCTHAVCVAPGRNLAGWTNRTRTVCTTWERRSTNWIVSA
jgi:hypothetical protein